MLVAAVIFRQLEPLGLFPIISELIKNVAAPTYSVILSSKLSFINVVLLLMKGNFNQDLGHYSAKVGLTVSTGLETVKTHTSKCTHSHTYTHARCNHSSKDAVKCTNLTSFMLWKFWGIEWFWKLKRHLSLHTFLVKTLFWNYVCPLWPDLCRELSTWLSFWLFQNCFTVSLMTLKSQCFFKKKTNVLSYDPYIVYGSANQLQK